MKGIIVEIKGNMAIVMTKKGCFEKVPLLAGYRDGLEIEYKNKPLFTYAKRKHLLPTAVILIFSLFAGTISYAWFSPFQYIDIDINPSVEFTGNRFHKIIRFRGINEDGRRLIEEAKLFSLSIEEGLNEILYKAQEQGYITGQADTDSVIISITADNEDIAEKTRTRVEEHINKEINDENSKMLLNKNNIAVLSFNEQEYQSAINKGASPGKMKLIEELTDNNGSYKEEELINAPVNKIIRELHEKRKKDEVNNPPDISAEDIENTAPQDQQERSTPPGLQDKDSTPPGLQDKDNTPPGLQDKDSTPPGLQDKDNTPPGLQDKDKDTGEDKDKDKKNKKN